MAKVDLDVLDRANAALYWERESRHDTVISLTYGRLALDALCRVMEAWIAISCFEVSIKPCARSTSRAGPGTSGSTPSRPRS